MFIPIAGIAVIVDPLGTYRYRMPPLETKIEGRGSGRTVIVNLPAVAMSLQRSPLEILKYFGYKLGSAVAYAENNKTKKQDHSQAIATINATVTTATLQRLLAHYIQEYVLCACGKPDTFYEFESSARGRVQVCLACRGCPARRELDMDEKLSSFIATEYQKEVKGVAQSTFYTKPIGHFEGKDASMSSYIPYEDIRKTSSDSTISSDSSLNLSKSEMIEEAILELKSLSAATVTEQLHVLSRIQKTLALSPTEKLMVFLGANFSEDLNVSKAVEQKQEVLSTLAFTPLQQRHLLGAFEWFCGTRHPSLVRSFAKVLMQLYDAEVVEEEVLLKWAKEKSPNIFSADIELLSSETLKALHVAAKPFIRWLKEAEVEDDSSKSSGSEEEKN